jgi:hypothetical protein
MSKAIVIHSLLDTLPFHDALSWEKFQAMCTDTLYKTANAIDSREYLSKGNVQHGIDIYAVNRGSVRKTVAQCKLKDYISPKQVLDIVDEFLKGNFVEETAEFILCTSADLGRQRDEEETIAQARKKLEPLGIEFTVWDERGLSRELRTDAPSLINIVYRYFGEEIAAAFYGRIWENHIASLITVQKHKYPLSTDHIERTIISYEERIKSGEQDDFFHWHGQKRDTLVSLVEEVPEKPKHFVLLSTAGFGKTEELRYVVGFFSPDNKLFFPFHYYLRDYEGQSIEDLLNDFEPRWRNVSDENLLLVLDGIDEISEHHTNSFINRLNAFVSLHPTSNVVVSSRYNFYNVRSNDLRDFRIYLLNPLRYYDIENYLDKKFGEQKQEFKTLLDEKGFNHFLNNPYYLTRLVRFFKENDRLSFPRNKSQFFQKTLFEKIEKDEDRYRIAELKKQLLPVAQQIAFCMTLAGKSSLTDDELKELVADEEVRKNLKHFSIFNRNSAGVGTWTFEHKNLQEYLCASVFVKRSFAEVHSIISFEKDAGKLLPRFLNTVSFLFELINKDEILFTQLFDWINTNEPELLIRFEKEQLSPGTRRQIFEKIFHSYKQKGFTLRISPHLSNNELSSFVDMDEEAIVFLGKELKSGLPPGLAYDAVELISKHKRPFLLQEQIESILFNVLNDPASENFVKGKAIKTFSRMRLASKQVFEKILKLELDFTDFEIRYACIVLLAEAEFAEDFVDFILKSILVFEEGQKESRMAGADDMIKHLLQSFNRPASVKKILQYCIWDKNTISHHHHYREFSLEFSQAKNLLEKASQAYKQDSSILPVVYRLYLTLEYLPVWDEWFSIFKNFFEQTCGINTIFQKQYRYGKKSRSIMSFAEAKACEFLTQEYLDGKIEDKQMTIYQNNLSWTDNPLFRSWNAKLNELTGGKFVYADLDVNYPELNELQKQKNQQMLLEKNLFFEESNALFDIIAKDKISQTDLWMLTKTDLRKYSASIVLEAIRNECRHEKEKVISKETFLRRFESQDKWDGFVVSKVKGWLKEQNPPYILPELRSKVEDWCVRKIEELDFEGSIKDGENPGSFTINNHKSYVKNLFLLLKVDIDDCLLLKMLPIDYSAFWSDDESISSLIIRKVKDRELLRTAVLQNISKGNLASVVLGSHFKICHQLNYKDCIKYLYKAITENPIFNDYDRVKLTDYYLDLGGEISDFEKYLNVPDEAQTSRYAAWQWLLIEKWMSIDSKRIIALLQTILQDENQTTNKERASQLLIQLSVVDGLVYWANQVIRQREASGERRWSNFQESIALMPAEQTINIFFSVLENNYDEALRLQIHSRDINEIVFTSLITIAKQDHANYLAIKNRILKLIADEDGNANVDALIIFSERLTQQYFESKMQDMDMASANLLYHQFTREKKQC